MSLALLKPKLLEAGTARLTGEFSSFGRESHAGPGAGKSTSVFFSDGRTRIRLLVSEESPVEIHVFAEKSAGGFKAELLFDDFVVQGEIEEEGLHCPKQAYITVSEGCIFRCRFCNVPMQENRIKTPDEIDKMIESVKDEIECISLTSGVIGSPEEDERRVIEVVKRIMRFNLPVGVSIYPVAGTPERLHDLGVCEVKFNLETATAELFKKICQCPSGYTVPDRKLLCDALLRSVKLFGKNR
ncbi:MAG: radical SAM protein, partial [Methanomicrobium sp.]|nr:radical SAM protein [Methanomicrobium sp.]